ncbi:hypothetical protein C8T65DRAFT_742912 [Cerioporus squamosus]|nr:hypothetical protein C8T65DRAFT_742912 [Cerioporus squamosus]
MGAHKLTNTTGATHNVSPMHADRHKNSDANRIPEVNIRQNVKGTRTQMLSDATDTSICMRVLQLLGQMIPISVLQPNLPSRDHATKVEWAFASHLRIAPGQKGRRKVSELVEGDYTNAWRKVDEEYHLLPGHFFSLSENKWEEKDRTLQKIDGAFYANEYKKDVVEGRPNWVRMGLPVEFKRGGTGLDPFDDKPGHNLEPDADKRKEVRGQVLSYAEHVVGNQHRTAVYMLFVNGPLFRVMRWDHSGVIVTEAIDYLHSVDGTMCLLTFLNCYSKVGPAGQGIDTTAIPLSEDSCGWHRMSVVAEDCSGDLDYNEHVIEDVSKLHAAFLDPARSTVSLGADDDVLHQDPGSYFRKSLDDGHPRYMIKVGVRTLLVGRHMFKASGLIGRGTRGFVALDWQSQRLVFLKDAWRPHYDGMKEEGEILEELNKAGVPHVPTVLAHGDVEGQETEASNYSPFTGPKKVKLMPAWPVRNDFDARAREIERTSTKKALPATVAGPDVDYSSVGPLPAHGSLTVLSGPAGYPTGTLPRPPLPFQNAGPSSEYIASQLASSSSSDSQSSSGTPDDGAAASLDDKVQSGSARASARTGAGVKRSAEEMERRERGAGLRHLIHYRVVMQDICLGAMTFKNSKQWVGIILDCVRAHAHAYDDCGYIHRDVSAGNILIRPIVRRHGNKGSVYWQGVLTDWELAKHKDVDYAREPDRTGTWHFMSWNLLSYPGGPVSIADELEAFVHVLIYGCVRFIHHNFKTINGFMYSYFDGFSLNDDSDFACPPAKRASLKAGKLTDGDRALTFVVDDGSTDHPLNDLIKKLLGLFKVRYQVLLWKKEHAPETPHRQKPRPSTNAAKPTESLPEVAFDRYVPDEWDDTLPAVAEDIMEVDNPEQSSQESAQKVPGEEEDSEQRPTPAMEEMVASLQAHKTIGKILTQFLKPNSTPDGMKKPVVWPANDKGPDRLVGYVPSDRTAVTQTLQKSSKRARTNTDSKPAKAESSTSRTKAAPTQATRQPSSRRIVAPSDRTTRSRDGTLPPAPSRGQGVEPAGSSTRATTRKGSGRGAAVTRADSGSVQPDTAATRAATVARSRSRGNLQDGRASGSGSKQGKAKGKGKAPARR